MLDASGCGGSNERAPRYDMKVPRAVLGASLCVSTLHQKCLESRIHA